MILAIDMGNTNITIGILDGLNIVFSERISTDRSKTKAEYLVQIKLLLDAYNIDLNKIDGGILSSVVPSLTNPLKEAMEYLLNKKVIVVGAGVKNGLNIKIDNPATLGADLVVDAVAAIEEYKTPIMIFDLGTATTLSVIDENKVYIGGMIIPGIKISQDALSSRAAQLPTISYEAPKSIIGKNTIDCMKSGIVYANACMIDGIKRRVEEEYNKKFTAILTGGLSSVIYPYTTENFIYDENLLLKGLYYIYAKNN